MGTTQSTTLNTDTDAKRTSSVYGDAGDGVSRWFQWRRSADGGDATQGLKADAAVTDPTSSATVVAVLKGILTFLRVSAAGVGKAEDAAHVTGDTGVAALAVRRDTAASSAGTDGDYVTINTDATGRLRTVAARDVDDALSIAASSAAADDLVVKASAGTLYSIVGHIAAGEDGYVQVHDATSQPADTAVPELSYFVGAASAAQAVNIPLPGHACGTGIVVVWSTTAATLTAGAANMFVTAHYD